ncbi:MAG: hypothetical protein WCK17_10720, partial [Verrucomicrobiota bacterium]
MTKPSWFSSNTSNINERVSYISAVVALGGASAGFGAGAVTGAGVETEEAAGVGALAGAGAVACVVAGAAGAFSESIVFHPSATLLRRANISGRSFGVSGASATGLGVGGGGVAGVGAGGVAG